MSINTLHKGDDEYDDDNDNDDDDNNNNNNNNNNKVYISSSLSTRIIKKFSIFLKRCGNYIYYS